MAVVGVRQCKRQSIGTRTRMAIQVPPESMALIHVQATDASHVRRSTIKCHLSQNILIASRTRVWQDQVGHL